jgi:D-alanine-D-alanine ligase
LLTRYRQPVLVESFLPGREFTVGVVGTGRHARALAVMEVVLREGAEAGAYSYENKEHYESNVLYRLADDEEAGRAAATALEVWQALDCRDGGRVDLRSDADGRPQFLEVNPLAGLNPVRSDLPIMCRLAGIGYDELIREILDSAIERTAGIRGGRSPRPELRPNDEARAPR